MRQGKRLSAGLQLLERLALAIALTLIGCATSPPAFVPVSKPANVTASESESSASWSQKAREWLKRASSELDRLTRD